MDLFQILILRQIQGMKEFLLVCGSYFHFTLMPFNEQRALRFNVTIFVSLFLSCLHARV